METWEWVHTNDSHASAVDGHSCPVQLRSGASEPPSSGKVVRVDYEREGTGKTTLEIKIVTP